MYIEYPPPFGAVFIKALQNNAWALTSLEKWLAQFCNYAAPTENPIVRSPRQQGLARKPKA